MNRSVSFRTYLSLGLFLFAVSQTAGADPFAPEPNSSFSLGFEEMQFLETAQSYHMINVQARGSVRGDIFEAVGDAEGLLTLNHPQDLSYLLVRETYAGNSSKTIHWSIGRKKMEWSVLDETWKMGVWQPRLRWDYLRPQTAGLTGLFFEQEITSWAKLALFGSPLFVPEQGAPFQIQNGQFQSSSPWFAPPLSSVDLFGKSTPVYYTLHTPSTSEVVLQPSWGLSTLLGESKGLWARASYGQKPVNQIFVDYGGTYNLSTSRAEIDVYPRIQHHHVATLETGWNTGRVRTWVAALAERPMKSNRNDADPNRTRQILGSTFAAGPSLAYDLFTTDSGNITVQASYLRLWGGVANDQGPLAPPSGSAFESRFPFQNAMSFEFIAPIYKFVAQGKVTYDTVQAAAIVSPLLQFRPDAHWSIHTGADFLGVEPLPSGSISPSIDMVRRYQTNDRVYGGIGYAF